MKRRILSLFLALAMLLALCGCGGTMGEIADNVMDAAMDKLKSEVSRVLEENKLEVVEIKTAFGKLNDEGSKYQFMVAALVKSNSTTVPQSTANTLSKIFSDAGCDSQNTSTFESSHLLHKDITFKHTDFSSGDYYVIWGYAADLSIDLPDFTVPAKN